MKTSKSNGFTLIELMVVISIIALLSSVVLASIKSAREKADDVKVVSELKSLQTALELYRNQSGNYPNVEVDEDDNCDNNNYCRGGFSYFVKQYLVDNKFILDIPYSKGSPDHKRYFFYFGRSEWLGNSNSYVYYMCGDKIVSGYILGYFSNRKINNLPIFKKILDDEEYAGVYEGYLQEAAENSGSYQYCISL